MPICTDCDKVLTPNGRHTSYKGKLLCGNCYVKAQMMKERT